MRNIQNKHLDCMLKFLEVSAYTNQPFASVIEFKLAPSESRLLLKYIEYLEGNQKDEEEIYTGVFNYTLSDNTKS